MKGIPWECHVLAKQSSNHIMPVTNMDKVEWVIIANKKQLSFWLAITGFDCNLKLRGTINHSGLCKQQPRRLWRRHQGYPGGWTTWELRALPGRKVPQTQQVWWAGRCANLKTSSTRKGLKGSFPKLSVFIWLILLVQAGASTLWTEEIWQILAVWNSYCSACCK